MPGLTILALRCRRRQLTQSPRTVVPAAFPLKKGPFIGIYAEEVSNDPSSTDSGFESLPLYEPGTYTPAGLSGQYEEGRIILSPNQKAILRSTRELRLVDGTIVLPSEGGVYHIEIRDGLPTFVDATVKEGGD